MLSGPNDLVGGIANADLEDSEEQAAILDRIQRLGELAAGESTPDLADCVAAASVLKGALTRGASSDQTDILEVVSGHADQVGETR